MATPQEVTDLIYVVITQNLLCLSPVGWVSTQLVIDAGTSPSLPNEVATHPSEPFVS